MFFSWKNRVHYKEQRVHEQRRSLGHPTQGDEWRRPVLQVLDDVKKLRWNNHETIMK